MNLATRIPNGRQLDEIEAPALTDNRLLDTPALWAQFLREVEGHVLGVSGYSSWSDSRTCVLPRDTSIASPHLPQQLPLPGIERVLSESEVAAFLGMDRATLRWWRRKKMKTLNPILRGKEWFYLESEVVALAAAQKKAPVVAGALSLTSQEIIMDINSLFPSNYLRADDFVQPRVFTIRGITVEEIGEERQKKPVLQFVEDPRGLVLNKTNAGMIAHSYGKDTDGWVTRQVELRAEPVAFQGRIVNSIRVRVVQPPAASPVVPPMTAPIPPPVVAPTALSGVSIVDDAFDV
jgi:hypothetical protein